jgi:diguanylate cyclase (GGDEF)-like protein
VTTPDPIETDVMSATPHPGAPIFVPKSASVRDALSIPALADRSYAPLIGDSGRVEGVVNLLQLRAELERTSSGDLERLLETEIGGWGFPLEAPASIDPADFPLAKSVVWSDGRLYIDWSLVEETLRRSEIDPVTQLPGRRVLDRRFAELIRRATIAPTPFALLLVDLDQFKPVNERYGHLAGDALLLRVARRLQEAIPADGFVGRFGGDEFVLLLPGVSPETVEPLLGRLLRGPTSDVIVERQTPNVPSLSIGAVIASTFESGMALLPLVEQADRCLRSAKRAGGARAHIVEVDAECEVTGEPREMTQ